MIQTTSIILDNVLDETSIDKINIALGQSSSKSTWYDLNDKNKALYAKYQKMATEEGDNIYFIGRLASYKYFNMDQAIKNSLDYYKAHFEEI